MLKVKLSVIICGAFLLFIACGQTGQQTFVIAESKAYEASLFRQNCAVCHGAEAEGRTLDNGTKVPSLRSGEHKFNTEAEIRRQITNGGNGMTPFGKILSDRELQLMTEFVDKNLRGN